MRQTIIDVITDSVTTLLYYDRKADENLPVGAIDQAIKDGIITIDEMVNEYRVALLKATE